MCGVGEDIYLAAINNNTYKVDVLKNRQCLFSLYESEEVFSFNPKSISVDGNSIYVSGSAVVNSDDRYKNIAFVCKNSDILYNLAIEGEKRSEAHSVVAIDGDVYVSGYSEADERYLCTWKNGKLLYKYEGYSSSGTNKLFVK